MGQTRKEWLQTVTAQLRCRRAVPGVERELENHLSEQYNAFVAQGCAPEEAERRTVESMGVVLNFSGCLCRMICKFPDFLCNHCKSSSCFSCSCSFDGSI